MSRVAAGLALLALMLQLTVSFGHTHLHVLPPAGAGTIASHIDRSSTGASLEKGTAGATEDEDICPVCFAGALLASSFIPAAATPSYVPAVFGTRYASSPQRLATPPRRVAFFRSRAPPSV